MCFEPEDSTEDAAGATDEETVGITEVDAVVTDDGTDSSWENSDGLLLVIIVAFKLQLHSCRNFDPYSPLLHYLEPYIVWINFRLLK
ncbi:hypothetical protein LOAG_06289 [Loa loa]|uniref:Uncharacterized protein n=1 Tax=Loa loa TaxID=7209 RepID=A0A1S0TXZ6_LOALO|nr:hypothetical protein LOAG_06289 [Loa loa]EFO22200.1 hypothetical protein LOAG_06289 [Loa loa]